MARGRGEPVSAFIPGSAESAIEVTVDQRHDMQIRSLEDAYKRLYERVLRLEAKWARNWSKS